MWRRPPGCTCVWGQNKGGWDRCGTGRLSAPAHTYGVKTGAGPTPHNKQVLCLKHAQHAVQGVLMLTMFLVALSLQAQGGLMGGTLGLVRTCVNK